MFPAWLSMLAWISRRHEHDEVEHQTLARAWNLQVVAPGIVPVNVAAEVALRSVKELEDSGNEFVRSGEDKRRWACVRRILRLRSGAVVVEQALPRRRLVPGSHVGGNRSQSRIVEVEPGKELLVRDRRHDHSRDAVPGM